MMLQFPYPPAVPVAAGEGIDVTSDTISLDVFALTTQKATPIGADHIPLGNSADGNTDYALLSALPVSTATQVAIDATRGRYVAVSTVVSAYQLALTDVGKIILVSSGSNLTVTIPDNATVAFAVGSQIDVVRFGAGTVTVSPAGGVTLNSLGSSRSISGQYGAVTLIKTNTNEWLLVGALT